jgi:hypothetical protein
MSKSKPNFIRLDPGLPEVAVLVAAMLQARQAAERRPWSLPQEPTAESWWADVRADPRARNCTRSRRFYGRAGKQAPRSQYTLSDEPNATISVACRKCPWSAAFSREELVATYGTDYPLPTLLDHLAAPGCQRVGNQWDRCGLYYVNSID